MKRFIKVFVLLAVMHACNEALAYDYVFVKKYDSNNRVISRANQDFPIYMYVNLMDYEFLGNRSFTAMLGSYNRYGDNFVATPAVTYNYHSTNNGWYIFICTVGYHSEYLYVKTDFSLVRMTFMAGGGGKYDEYARTELPRRDFRGPTYGSNNSNHGNGGYGSVVSEQSKEWHDCSSCYGTGRCKHCNGTGDYEYSTNGKCGVCRGTGRCAGCEGKGGYYI